MDPTYEETPTIQSKIIEFIETLVVFLAIGTAVYLFIAQPHKVSGSSMFPTLHSGDYIITNKIEYKITQPKRGEIIVFKSPRDADSVDFIKRIIGLPGDRVKVENGHFYINDALLAENYLQSTILTLPGAFLREGEEVVVSPDHYLVIGDNRMASSDSREWGFISREEIIGKAFLRYWPITSFGLIYSATFSN